MNPVILSEAPTIDQKVDRATIKPSRRKIWIDLDNSPHVPFFLPIMDELKSQGYELFVTARNSYQVCELLDLYNVKCRVLGKHWGKHRILKVLGTVLRTLQLLPLAVREKPDLAVSHGSRSQLLLGKLLRIPTILIYDYEHTQRMSSFGTLWFVAPEYLPDPAELQSKDRMHRYPGLKEDVYVSFFHPDPTLRAKLGVSDDELMITVRPPASEAHYHNAQSDVLLDAALNFFMEQPCLKVILLPRNDRQAVSLNKTWAKWISEGKIIIPEHAVDGLNLIWSSDLVVSGGGTMNREAAALRVPVYSIFRGKIGAVDHFLAEQKRMTLIESVEEIRSKIALIFRDRSIPPQTNDLPARRVIVNKIVSILNSATQRSKK